jgi:hypothetical protein
MCVCVCERERERETERERGRGLHCSDLCLVMQTLGGLFELGLRHPEVDPHRLHSATHTPCQLTAYLTKRKHLLSNGWRGTGVEGVGVAWRATIRV